MMVEESDSHLLTVGINFLLLIWLSVKNDFSGSLTHTIVCGDQDYAYSQAKLYYCHPDKIHMQNLTHVSTHMHLYTHTSIACYYFL